MQCKCDKIGFLSLVKEVLNAADLARIEEFLKLAVENYFYLAEGVTMNEEDQSGKMSELEFFDYLYCLLRVCDFDVDEFFRCLNVQYPSKIVFEDKGISLDRTLFERIVNIWFNQESAKEIIHECDRIASESDPRSASSLFGNFYITLFVCGFDKETFLRNLANYYGMKSYIRNKIRDVNEVPIECLEVFHDVNDIEKQIKKGISYRLSFESYEKHRNRDCFDEVPEKFRPWPQDIISVVTREDFVDKLAWLVYDIFPESSFDAQRKVAEDELDTLKHYLDIARLKPEFKIAKVTIDLWNNDGSWTKMPLTSPNLLDDFGHFLVEYYRLAKGITAVDSKEYQDEIEVKKTKLRDRLYRRTALLLCHYGLCEKGDEKKYDMWYYDNGCKTYVKFGDTYGSLIFILLKSIPKCLPVLNGKNGVNPTTRKDMWDLIGYCLKKSDWQDSEIQMDQFSHIPFSLKSFTKYR